MTDLSTRPDGDSLAGSIALLAAERGVFVGGQWRTGSAGTFDVENPATGRVIASVADGDARDAEAAVDAAAGSLRAWAAIPPRGRSELLSRVRELMLRDADRLAELIAAENGKSLTDARG